MVAYLLLGCIVYFIMLHNYIATGLTDLTTARTTPFGKKWRNCAFIANSVDGEEILNYWRWVKKLIMYLIGVR